MHATPKPTLSRRSRTVWLLATFLLALPGVSLGLLFAQEIYWPFHFTGDMQGLVVMTGTIMLVPGRVGLLIGAGLMGVGLKRFPVLFKMGCGVLVLASLYFVPIGVELLQERAYGARFDECMNMTDAELERLVAEQDDRAAQAVLAHREAQRKAARYRAMDNNELRRLWNEQEDLFARDILEQRRTIYSALEPTYRALSDEELRRRLREEDDGPAWFELEGREGEQRTVSHPVDVQ